jgi:hypothetical protein
LKRAAPTGPAWIHLLPIAHTVGYRMARLRRFAGVLGGMDPIYALFDWVCFRGW